MSRAKPLLSTCFPSKTHGLSTGSMDNLGFPCSRSLPYSVSFTCGAAEEVAAVERLREAVREEI